MFDQPEIVTTRQQHTAVIHLTIPVSEVRTVMGPGLQEVHAAIAAQGLKPAGPWLTHHLTMPGSTFDFEIAVPVSTPIQPNGRVKPSTLPATTVARATYAGGYEGLGDAWGELMKWIEKNGHQGGPDLWEVYAVGPEVGPDPAAYRTVLHRPLTKVGKG